LHITRISFKKYKDKTINKGVLSLVKKSFIIIFTICFNLSISVSADTIENTVSAILSVKVTTTVDPSGIQTPISNARIVLINSFGEIIGTELTNSQGEAKLPVTVPKDPRFNLKKIGEVTIIVVANGYNEYIDFSVPINEFNDNTGSVSIPLWDIDPQRRNEPQFVNGSFHRFTVFEMLDNYAKKMGLKRQNIKEEGYIGPVPWGPELINQ
jgi:hypothetical protein